MRRDKIIIIALIVLTCISRVPFATKYIVTHDSVGYALALKEFDIAKHQPYPPGYILYVGLAKLINLCGADANTSYIILSLLFSSLAVAFIYLLGKELLSPRCGLISALFLFSSPMFWAYGELALCYTVDAFGSTVIAYLGYKSYKTGRSRYFSLLNIVLGLIAGIRLYLLIFLFPLWVRIMSSIKVWKEGVKQILILVCVCLGWFIPLVFLSGGFTKYFDLKLYSYFDTAFLPQLRSFKTLAYAFASSLWALGAVILSLFVKPVLPHKKELFYFSLIWCGWAVFFHFLLFMGTPAHTLFFLPCFILFLSSFAYNRLGKGKITFTAIIILSNIILFFTVRPLEVGERILGVRIDKFRNFANFWVLDHSNKGLRKKEKNKEVLDFVSDNFSSQGTAICVASGKPFQPNIPWRLVYYYLPGFSIYKLGDEPQIIKTPADTIVWLIDKTDLEVGGQNFEPLLLLESKCRHTGEEVYFSVVTDSLIFGNYMIKKK